jgi:adenylate cyclase
VIIRDGTTNLPGGHIFICPSVWLAPLVLSFGTLRFNPLLQAYITLLICRVCSR